MYDNTSKINQKKRIIPTNYLTTFSELFLFFTNTSLTEGIKNPSSFFQVRNEMSQIINLMSILLIDFVKCGKYH